MPISFEAWLLTKETMITFLFSAYQKEERKNFWEEANTATLSPKELGTQRGFNLSCVVFTVARRHSLWKRRIWRPLIKISILRVIDGDSLSRLTWPDSSFKDHRIIPNETKEGVFSSFNLLVLTNHNFIFKKLANLKCHRLVHSNGPPTSSNNFPFVPIISYHGLHWSTHLLPSGISSLFFFGG